MEGVIKPLDFIRTAVIILWQC